MGWISGDDENHEHEGWIAMTFADGKLSSGSSNGNGHWIAGYKYLPRDENDPRTWGNIDPAYLRPFSEVVGWLPKCECGWTGVEIRIPEPDELVLSDVDTIDQTHREPSGFQEELIMSQWRIHIRETCDPKAYTR